MEICEIQWLPGQCASWTRTGLDSYLDLVIAGQQQQQQVFSVPYGDAPQREWHHQKCVCNPKTQSWKTGKSSECQTRFEGMGVDVNVEELSAGQKLRIAESAQHQRRGELLSSPPAWNLSQSFALFFFLFSHFCLCCALGPGAWFGFDAISTAFTALLLSLLLFRLCCLLNRPLCRTSLPLSLSLPSFPCLCNIPYPFATTRKKNTQRRQTTPLQDDSDSDDEDEDMDQDDYADDDGVAFALTVLPSFPSSITCLAHPHPQRQDFNSNWYCRHCYCCCPPSRTLSSPLCRSLPPSLTHSAGDCLVSI